MSEQYKSMWKDLGLDLDAHDALLGVLNTVYGDIFLSQPDRAEGMEYFDFVMSEVHGLRIQELIKEQETGRKIVGSFCVFVPEEIVLAANATLVGLCSGAEFATEEVEKYLPRNTCALIKSALGFKLAKVCPYIEVADLIVGENTCDGKKKSFETWQQLIPNLHVMDLPQAKSDAGRQVLVDEYKKFAETMESLTGTKITFESLKNAIQLVNKKRTALHRLAKLRSRQPAMISGLDALLINQVSFYDNPERFCNSVNAICDAIEKRLSEDRQPNKDSRPRVVISGCPMAVPNWKLPSLIEGSGALIVGEESCIGERGSRNLVDDSGDTIDELFNAIIDRYFEIDCAIFTPNQSRLDHILELVDRTDARGVIHYGLQFCQPYIMESIPIEKALEEKGIPALRIETDYSMEDVGQLKTRVEAFLELLE